MRTYHKYQYKILWKKQNDVEFNQMDVDYYQFGFELNLLVLKLNQNVFELYLMYLELNQ